MSWSRARGIVAVYDGFWARAYASIRFFILRPSLLDSLERELPRRGRVLDLGSGFGLSALYYGLAEPEREILGVEIDARRVERARSSATRLAAGNVRFACGDVRETALEAGLDAAYLIDVLHHVPRDDVPRLLERVATLLAPDGLLLLKEIADRPRWKAWFTLAADRAVVGLAEPIHYWPVEELTALLHRLGFEVEAKPLPDFLPYPHVLYVCRRQAGRAGSGAARYDGGHE